MRKLAFLALICFVTTMSFGQSKKLYVSKQGGTKKLLTLWKISYNNYHFASSDACDSLICSGSGFERCKVDQDIIRLAKEEGKYYPSFNKAIRFTEKLIRKTKSESGQMTLVIDDRKMSIKYYNADRKGNSDMEIEII
jgi:hypothetical protein